MSVMTIYFCLSWYDKAKTEPRIQEPIVTLWIQLFLSLILFPQTQKDLAMLEIISR